MLTKRDMLALAATLGVMPAGAQELGGLAPAMAPEGALRAVINIGNPILAARSPGDPAPFGVSVDLTRELARRLGVAAELITMPSAGRAVETIRAGQADIGFFAIDSARGQGIDFTAPYVEIEGTYLVPTASPITRIEEVDRPGIRIAVGLNSAYDLFLRREIRAATLVRAPTSPTVVEEFLRQNLDVAAGVRQQLELDAARLHGLRVLPGRFMVIQQAMGLAAGRDPAAIAALVQFVEEMKHSGFVAAALARHNIQGALVAPPR